MIRATCCCLTLLVLAAAAGAQTDERDIQPFTGAITGDRVNVRSGASLNYYRVTTLSDGDLVQVRSQLYRWYEIEPPEGVTSLISKQYVRPDAEGRTGRVTGDRVNVRAPSPQGPDSSYKIQTTLNSGDRVRIVGEEGDWYRIAPPDAATLWVHSDYIREATDAEIRAARADAPETSDPADVTDDSPGETETGNSESDAGGQPRPRVVDSNAADDPAGQTDGADDRRVAMNATDTTPSADAQAATSDTPAASPEQADAADAATSASPATATATATGAGADASDQADPRQASPTDDTTSTAEGDPPGAGDDGEADAARQLDQRLNELERRFAELSARPLAEQTGLASLRDAYRELAETRDLTEEQRVVVDTRLELLNGRLELQQAMAELEQRKAELEARRNARPLSYDAVGRLVASSLYDGEDLPRLYRLVDSMTGLTVGYVEPSDAVDLVDALGRTVGVVGETRYDPSLRLKIITPEALYIVSGEGR